MINYKECPKGNKFLDEWMSSPRALFFVETGTVQVQTSGFGPGGETPLGLFGVETKRGEATISKGGYFGSEGFIEPSRGKMKPAQYRVVASEDCAVVGALEMSEVWNMLAGAKTSSSSEQIPLKSSRCIGS